MCFWILKDRSRRDNDRGHTDNKQTLNTEESEESDVYKKKL